MVVEDEQGNRYLFTKDGSVRSIGLTDPEASPNGSGNGAFWFPGAGDGDAGQGLKVWTGAGGEHTLFFTGDGVLTVNGAPVTAASAVAQAGVYGNFDSSAGVETSFDLVGGRSACVTSPPLFLGAGSGNGVVPYVSSNDEPDLSLLTTLSATLELSVSNAAGTERLVLNSGLVPIGDVAAPDLSEWTPVAPVTAGTDLAVSADGLSVESTAGGTFFVCLLVRTTTTG